MRRSEWAKGVIERDGRCRECGGSDSLMASGVGGEGFVVCRGCYWRVRAKVVKPKKVEYRPKGEIERWARKTLIRRIHELEAKVKELQGE